MNVKSLRVLSCTAVLALAACGDNGTEVDLGDLTESEAAALGQVITADILARSMAIPTEPQATGPQGVPISGNQQLSGEVPCGLGGTVAFSSAIDYEYDDESGEGEASFSLIQTHNDCVAESDGGLVFTLNGAPQIAAEVFLQVSEETLAIDGGYTGSVDWATDGREGTCSVNVELSMGFNVANQTGSATNAGTVCGVTFSESLTVG